MSWCMKQMLIAVTQVTDSDEEDANAIFDMIKKYWLWENNKNDDFLYN